MASSAQDRAQPAGEIPRKKLCSPNEHDPVAARIAR